MSCDPQNIPYIFDYEITSQGEDRILICTAEFPPQCADMSTISEAESCIELLSNDYKCLVGQLRLRSSNSIIKDWFIAFSNLPSMENAYWAKVYTPPIKISDDVCYVDFRMSSCCQPNNPNDPTYPPFDPPPENPDPPLPPKEPPPPPWDPRDPQPPTDPRDPQPPRPTVPPFWDPRDPQPTLPPDNPRDPEPPVSDPPFRCSDYLLPECNDPDCNLYSDVTDPYINPLNDNYISIDEDIINISKKIDVDYNRIYLPSKIRVRIDHTNCSDIRAYISSEKTNSFDATKCLDMFYDDIYFSDLPQIDFKFNNLLGGSFIGSDAVCDSGSLNPSFDTAIYSRVDIYYQPNISAIPFIDGIGANTSSLNRQSAVLLYTTETADQAREWIKNHLVFYTLYDNFTRLRYKWKYVDLYWKPFDNIDDSVFIPEQGVLYLNVVPTS